jgi:glycosyltransferase involved in cell wall biosynthesis
MASVTNNYPDPTEADIAATREKFELPERFLYFPAQTYPSKNHLRLFEALAIIRSRHGVEIPLICSGWINPFYKTLRKRLAELDLERQVRFLGFVTPLEIQCLYRSARAMVFPSTSEGWGLPIQEAFASGTPVASSNVMSLPEQIGDAGLLFDPHQPDQIAGAIWRLWTDDELCRVLSERGRETTTRYTWERTARHFRAYYRKLAGAPLTEEDRMLIAEGA